MLTDFIESSQSQTELEARLTQCLDFRCDECNAHVTGLERFGQHVLKHLKADEKKSLVCDRCAFRAKNIESLNAHAVQHYAKKPSYKCDTCGNLFKGAKAFEAHLGEHGEADKGKVAPKSKTKVEKATVEEKKPLEEPPKTKIEEKVKPKKSLVNPKEAVNSKRSKSDRPNEEKAEEGSVSPKRSRVDPALASGLFRCPSCKYFSYKQSDLTRHVKMKH